MEHFLLLNLLLADVCLYIDVQTNSTPRLDVTDIGNFPCAKSSTCKVVWFLFNWVVQGDRKHFPLEKALVRVYKEKIGRHIIDRGLVRVNISACVDLHAALDSHSQRHNITFSCDNKEWVPVGTVEVGADTPEEEWLEVNLNPAIQSKWKSNMTSSLIRVALKLESATKLPVKIFNLAKVNKSLHPTKWAKKLAYQPHLLIFAADEKIKKMLNEMHSAYSGIDVQASNHKNSRVKRSLSDSGRTCSFQHYTLTFSDLGINHIVVPSQLKVGFCTGTCNLDFLTLNPQKGTNHALLMSTAHQLKTNESIAASGGITPKIPCCAPVEYSPAYLLESRSEWHFEVQLYPDLVVKSCGCL